VLISAGVKMVYVYRHANQIARAPLEIDGLGPVSGHVVALLDGFIDLPCAVSPDRDFTILAN
jgi:hypothetical protein